MTQSSNDNHSFQLHGVNSLSPPHTLGYGQCSPPHRKRAGFCGHPIRPEVPRFPPLSYGFSPTHSESSASAAQWPSRLGGPPYTATSETQRRNPLCMNALTPFNVVYPLSMLQEHLLVPSISTAFACSRPLAMQLTATATQAAATVLSCLFLSPPRHCLGYLREGLSLTAFLSNFGHGSALAQGLQSVLPPF